jgi:hypothetical protein
MRFITFVKRNYLRDNSFKGVFARFIKSEGRNFPVRSSYRTYWKYLHEQCQAPQEVLAAFDECFCEWKEHERTNH